MPEDDDGRDVLVVEAVAGLVGGEEVAGVEQRLAPARRHQDNGPARTQGGHRRLKARVLLRARSKLWMDEENLHHRSDRHPPD